MVHWFIDYPTDWICNGASFIRSSSSPGWRYRSKDVCMPPYQLPNYPRLGGDCFYIDARSVTSHAVLCLAYNVTSANAKNIPRSNHTTENLGIYYWSTWHVRVKHKRMFIQSFYVSKESQPILLTCFLFLYLVIFVIWYVLSVVCI